MNAENANNPESEKSQDSDSWFNIKNNLLQYAIPFNLYINNIINNASTLYIKKNNEIKFSKKDIVYVRINQAEWAKAEVTDVKHGQNPHEKQDLCIAILILLPMVRTVSVFIYKCSIW
jgi:hypothetical protein